MAILQDMKISKEITITKKEVLVIVIASISGAIASQMYNEIMDAFSDFNGTLAILITIIFMVVFMSVMILLISSAAYWLIKITDRKRHKKRE